MRGNMTFEKVLPKDANHPYTIVSNDASCFMRDCRLSGNERTILFAMFSANSETWDFSVSGLQKICSLGRTAIYTALKRLQQHGYLFIEKRRNAKGKFAASMYHFYEVACSVTGEEEKNSSAENNVPTSFYPCTDFTDTDLTQTELETQITTNKTIKKSPSIKSQSVSLEETTDGLKTNLQEEDYSIGNNEQFTHLENLMKNQSNYDAMKQELKDFIPNAIKYLKEAVISGSIELSEVIDKLEEIISKEGSLFAFLKKISYKCKKALKKLKRPSAKDNFLISTIRNQLQEYKPKMKEIQNQSEQVPKKQILEHQSRLMPSQFEPTKKEHSHLLSFKDMLSQIGNPLLKDRGWYGDEAFENEEAFKESYGEFDIDEWEIRQCSIPDSFKDRPRDMENALKFLTGWSSLPSDDFLETEYKEFVGNTIHFLAKAIHTSDSLSAQNMISRLNYINMDMHERDETLHQFMKYFYKHFQEKVHQYPVQSNQEKYITTMLVNYLMHDYQARDMIGIAKATAHIGSFKKK